jgi:hypothetical protein
MAWVNTLETIQWFAMSAATPAEGSWPLMKLVRWPIDTTFLVVVSLSGKEGRKVCAVCGDPMIAVEIPK